MPTADDNACTSCYSRNIVHNEVESWPALTHPHLGDEHPTAGAFTAVEPLLGIGPIDIK